MAMEHSSLKKWRTCWPRTGHERMRTCSYAAHWLHGAVVEGVLETARSSFHGYSVIPRVVLLARVVQTDNP